MTTDNSEVNVRILFFAKSRELSGIDEINIQLPSETSFNKLLNILCEKFNINIIRDTLILAINENYCDNTDDILKLKTGDEIAIIPPISGG